MEEQITSTNESPPRYASNVVTICTLHTVHVTTNQAYCFIRCKYFTISCKQTRTQQVQTPFPGLTHREEGDGLLALSHEDFRRLVRDTSLPKQLIYVAESTRIEFQQRTVHTYITSTTNATSLKLTDHSPGLQLVHTRIVLGQPFLFV